jgi:hypothetical protein
MHNAALRLAAAKVERIIVTLRDDDVEVLGKPDGAHVETVLAWTTDGKVWPGGPGLFWREAEKVWDAAVERFGDDVGGPVMFSPTGTGPVRVEMQECQCNPWAAPDPCDACGGSGFVWWPKREAGAA